MDPDPVPLESNGSLRIRIRNPTSSDQSLLCLLAGILSRFSCTCSTAATNLFTVQYHWWRFYRDYSVTIYSCDLCTVHTAVGILPRFFLRTNRCTVMYVSTDIIKIIFRRQISVLYCTSHQSRDTVLSRLYSDDKSLYLGVHQ